MDSASVATPPTKEWWYVMERGNRLGAMELYPDEAIPGMRVNDPVHPGLYVTVIEPTTLEEVAMMLSTKELIDN